MLNEQKKRKLSSTIKQLNNESGECIKDALILILEHQAEIIEILNNRETNKTFTTFNPTGDAGEIVIGESK